MIHFDVGEQALYVVAVHPSMWGKIGTLVTILETGVWESTDENGNKVDEYHYLVSGIGAPDWAKEQHEGIEYDPDACLVRWFQLQKPKQSQESRSLTHCEEVEA